MVTAEDLEKRLKTLANRLQKAKGEQATEPCLEKVRKIRKRVRRNQRKLRKLCAVSQKKGQTEKKPEGKEKAS